MAKSAAQDQVAPGLYDKGFREDLVGILQAKPEALQAMVQWIAGISKLREFTDAQTWVPLADNAKLSIDDLQEFFQPLQFLAVLAIEDNMAIGSLWQQVRRSGAIPEGTDESNERHVIRLLSEVVRLSKPSLSVRAPDLPLKRIRQITSRCIFVSEFDEEFEIGRHTTSNYSPSLRKLFVRTSLEFQLRNDKKVSLILTTEDIETLISWLSLAKVQMDVASRALPDQLLLKPSED